MSLLLCGASLGMLMVGDRAAEKVNPYYDTYFAALFAFPWLASREQLSSVR
jgi:hypothetical protein